MEDEGQESPPRHPHPHAHPKGGGRMSRLSPRRELGVDKLAQCPAPFSRDGITPDMLAQCSAAPSFPNQHRQVSHGVFSFTWTALFTHSCGAWSLKLLQSGGASLRLCGRCSQGARHLSRLFFTATLCFLVCRCRYLILMQI